MVGQPAWAAFWGFDAVEGEVECWRGEDDWEKWVAAEPVEANEGALDHMLARPDDPELVDDTEMRGRCWYGFGLGQYMAFCDCAIRRLADARQDAPWREKADVGMKPSWP